jgi:Ran GTPase-activating protein (RanGAP) involved in mRNA processing and transport
MVDSFISYQRFFYATNLYFNPKTDNPNSLICGMFLYNNTLFYYIKRMLFAKVLRIVPATDWCSTWDASRTIMLRQTSKKIKNIIDSIRPPTDVIVNMNFWNDICNGTANEKIQLVMKNVVSLATTCYIRHLVLPCEMSDKNAIQFERYRELFEYCKSSPNINVYNNNLDATDVASIIGMFERCVSLNIAFNHIGHEGTENLVKMLTQCTYLNIADNNIGTAGVKSIENCKTLTTLNSLDLCYNQIGAINIDKILFHNTGLTYLNISQNLLNTLSYERITTHLALTNLDVSYNPLGVEGISSLAGILTQCPALTNLNLSYTLIGVEGGAILANVIGNCTSLSVLRLAGNTIGETGIESIAVSLSICTSLTHLPLIGNGIGEESKNKIEKILGHRVKCLL